MHSVSKHVRLSELTTNFNEETYAVSDEDVAQSPMTLVSGNIRFIRRSFLERGHQTTVG